MRMKRFPAKTIPQALADVQRALGPNAVLLETRKVSDPERRKRGELVEVLAAVDPQAIPRKRTSGAARDVAPEADVSPPMEQPGAGRTLTPFEAVLSETPPVPPLPSAAADALINLQEAVAALRNEVGELRREVHCAPPLSSHNELIVVTASLVELGKKVDHLLATGTRRPHPLAGGWQAEVPTTLLGALEACGLDGYAARYWGGRVNADLADRPWRPGETPVARLAEIMGSELRCAPGLPGGEVHVVLGGSGAGKSSLVVKLALRERLLHGRSPMLITLDHVRPEGAALLRRYAEVFGLALHRVSDAPEMAAVVARIGSARPCFVDAPATTGEVEALPQIADVLGTLPETAVRHLLLPAAMSLPEMRRQVAVHTALGIDRLAFSRIDEACHFGQMVAIATETDLPVSWLGNGRQIPEDVVDASRDLLCALMTRRGHETSAVPPSSARSAAPAGAPPVAADPPPSFDGRCIPFPTTARSLQGSA